MRQNFWRFIGLLLFFLMVLNKVYSTPHGFIPRPIETERLTYFTDATGLFPSPSQEKPLYSQSSNSPQQDTSKKKLVKPNNDLVPQTQTKIATNEIDALVLDATFSPGGYDFYVLFTQNWTPPNNASNYTILVKEYPGRGVNIVVAIEVNGKQLVYRRMRPTYPAVQSLAVAAANYLNGYVARGDHLRGVDADGNFIDVIRTDVTRQIRTPFDVY